MRFLGNMNISPRLLKRLAGEEHECHHVIDLGMQKATDREIIERARTDRAVIITCDLDYGQILAVEESQGPSVILFRTTNIHPDYLYRILARYWRQVEASLQTGAFVIIEDTRIRIRELPMGGEKM